MTVKLLTEHHLEFLSFKGGCRGSSESTHVKIPHCWKSHALAHMSLLAKKDPENVICQYCLLHMLTNHFQDAESKDPDQTAP